MKTSLRERPFEYLRRRGTKDLFPDETVRNWYIARAYVRERLKDIAFAPGEARHLTVEIDGDSPLMLAILRQVALSAHYPNFVEYDQLGQRVCRNRTHITLVSAMDADQIVAELGKEEVLCHLIQHVPYSVYGSLRNEDSYLDIELEIVHQVPHEDGVVVIGQDEVLSFIEGAAEEYDSIDTRMAVCAGRTYSMGAVIDNLPYEDIHGPGRYNQALDTFQYRILRDRKDLPLISPAWKESQHRVKSDLSSLFCADCFRSRELSISKLVPDYKRLSDKKRKELWEQNNLCLSLSEHSRWNVEKLILGYRPLSEAERVQSECLFGAEKKAYLQQLKSNAASPAHIDICSYQDLRRIDPDSLKYDSFLMLAIPLILKRIR